MWQYCQSTLLQPTPYCRDLQKQGSWQWIRVLQHGLQLLVSLTSLFQRIVRLWSGATSRQRKFKRQISWDLVATNCCRGSKFKIFRDLPFSKANQSVVLWSDLEHRGKSWLVQLFSFPFRASRPPLAPAAEIGYAGWLPLNRKKTNTHVSETTIHNDNGSYWIIMDHNGSSWIINHNMS